MADWTQAESTDDNWAIQNVDASIFDGAFFDIDIFDALTGFTKQTTPDPNWN